MLFFDKIKDKNNFLDYRALFLSNNLLFPMLIFSINIYFLYLNISKGIYKMQKNIYDITIIGAGPVGLFAAFYAGIRNAKTKIIDGLPHVGGQLAALYPEKYIYDVPGFPEIKARSLINNLEKQIRPFEHSFHLEEEVQTIQPQEDYLCIKTNKNIHYSKAVIIATGNGSFQPRRLTLKNIQSFEGNSIHYSIKDTNYFKDKNIAVAGGGDSAIDWALMLEPIAKNVSIIHRRPDFRGHEHSVKQLKNSSIAIYTPYTIENIVTKDEKLTGIKLKKTKEETRHTLAIDELIVNYGISSSSNRLENWGVTTNRNAVQVHSDMSTNIPGVYAVGDICHYDGKVKLIATGFGEAPTAVNNALHYIKPMLRKQPVHSTSLFDKNN